MFISKKYWLLNKGYGALRYQGRLCVSRADELQGRIMEKAHISRYFIHLGSTKMYRDLREVYWWSSMKKGIAEFFAKHSNFQQVKVEHQRNNDSLRIQNFPYGSGR